MSRVPAIIVDIDGTIASHPQRGHHDYDAVSTDEPIQNVIDLVRLLADRYEIVYVSGRPDRCREDTRNWLVNHGLPFPEFFFQRKTGDYRPDDVVKRELYDAHIAGEFDVKYVLDDRNRVVKMWRELGLTVLQVADGDF